MKNLLASLEKTKISKEVYKQLPESAGVYLFFEKDTPIYIGKAINLKRRVGSYFDLDLAPKTQRMVETANFISYIRVESELESLLLEAKLIRKYMPKYNIELKDDKHPLYIVITKEEFPRVLSARKLITNYYSLIASYGPFPSSENVRSVLKMIRRIFPYSDHKVGKRKCFYSHIGLCEPCPNEIERIENSEKRIVLSKKYKKNIKAIKSILDGKVEKVKTDLEKEMNLYSKSGNFEEAAKVRDQIQRLEYIIRPQMPSDYYIENPNLYSDQRKLEIESLKKIIMENGKWKVEDLDRVECYDIAHLSGTNPTASMVTFTEGEADKNYYRHFKIKTAKGGDDFESMKEVARRRIKHFDDWKKPDLIIVDGGLGQVKSFASVLYDSKVDIPVVGIAKNPDRLVFENGNKVKLQGATLQLVSRMRDEAHRFARRYHHHLISKMYTNENHT